MTKPYSSALIIAAFGFGLGAGRASGQGSVGNGTFQDLDFSQGNIVHNAQGQTEAGPALPGWSAYVATAPQTTILYDDLALGSAAVALLGPGYSFDGGYIVALQSDLFPGERGSSLQQTGIIPGGANSLLFNTPWPSGSGPALGATFDVSVDGQLLSPLLLVNANGIATFGASISSFAGQSATLQFAVVDTAQYTGSMFQFTDITFSSEMVPESGTAKLLGLGVLALISSLGRRFPT